jgi:quercetin dioxygenase-like cupin family protein
MATVGKTITNSKTGQSYHFLQTAKSTNGSLLEMESVYDAYSKQPPMHYHPYQEEYFKILKGEITVKLGSVPKYLKQGDELYIPPNTDPRHLEYYKSTRRYKLESNSCIEVRISFRNYNRACQ